MTAKEKVQAPIRLNKEDYERIREKVKEQGITFQKLMEILLSAYLRDNKEILAMIQKFSGGKEKKKKTYDFDELERLEIARMLEREYSPLKNDGDTDEK